MASWMCWRLGASGRLVLESLTDLVLQPSVVALAPCLTTVSALAMECVADPRRAEPLELGQCSLFSVAHARERS